MRKLLKTAVLSAAAVAASTASAAGFVNGGFEDGNTGGWVIGGGSRSSQNLSAINANDYLPGGSRYTANIANTHSAIVTAGSDANASPVSSLLPASKVYSGNYALRIEDTTTGGYVSVAKQTVTNYTDANIFFAWLAVLENGGHSAEQSAAMIIKLNDLTTGETVISRVYNAVGGGGGVDSRFSQQGNYFYTANWQIEQLSIDATRQGHDFELIVLGSDCGPTAHEGFMYLDGFGAVTPPTGGGSVPEPVTALLAGMGLLGIAGASRRAKKAKQA
jgi:hypothetical protein